MRRTSLVGLATLVACLIASSSALAWGGAKVNSISCPEIHALLPVEHGNWAVVATDEQGHTLLNVQVPGSASEQVIGGLYTLDPFTHQVTVTVGNAANIQDGKVTLTRQLTNCQAPVGSPGPAGPAGPAGPPGTPGVNGKDGVTTTITIIKPGPKSCSVSRREFLLTLPKDYRGLKNLRVNVAGKTSTMTVRNGKVHISLKGLKCGVYAVAIRHEHRRTVKRLYTVNAGNVTAYNVRLPNDPKPDSVSRG